MGKTPRSCSTDPTLALDAPWFATRTSTISVKVVTNSPLPPETPEPELLAVSSVSPLPGESKLLEVHYKLLTKVMPTPLRSTLHKTKQPLLPNYEFNPFQFSQNISIELSIEFI